MHFEKLLIHGFGCLRTATPLSFSPYQLNLIIAPNEEGKSTLVAAFLAAFYGINRRQRGGNPLQPSSEQYKPWIDPDRFGLELHFTYEGTNWILERDFAQEGTDLRLINLASGREMSRQFLTDGKSRSIGERFFRLNIEEFLKSFYLRQDEFLLLKDAQSLVHQVQRTATSIGGELTSHQAINLLEGILAEFPLRNRRNPLQVKNVLSRLNEAIERAKGEVERISRQMENLEGNRNRLIQLEQDIQRKTQERDEKRRETEWAEIAELREQLQTQQTIEAQLEEKYRERDQLQPYASFPAHRLDELVRYIGDIELLGPEREEKQRKLQEEVLKPREEIERQLHDSRLAGISSEDVQHLQETIARLQERHERMKEAYREYQNLAQQADEETTNREQYETYRKRFSQLTPAQLQFIEDFERHYKEGESALREVRTRREAAQRERDLIFSRNRKISRAVLFFIGGALAALFGGGVALYLNSGIWQLLVGLSLVLGAMGLIIKVVAGSSDKEDLNRVREELKRHSEQERSLQSTLQQLESELDRLAQQQNFENGWKMIGAFTHYQKQERLMEPLLRAERAFESSREEFLRGVEELEHFYHRAAQPLPDVDKVLEESQKLLERYRQAAELRERFNFLKRREDELRTEITRLTSEHNDRLNRAEEILKEGNISKEGKLEERVNRFREGAHRFHQYHLLNDQIIPTLENRLLPPSDKKRKEERVHQLMARWGLTQPPPALPFSKEQYREEWERLERELKTLNEEAQELRIRFHSQYNELHKNRSQLLLKIQQWEEMKAEVEEFKSGVELAIEQIQSISANIYQTWAETLSREGTLLLSHLNPRYTDFLFDGQLKFTIRDGRTQRIITSEEVERFLSAGARDQIFLAARLAITRYLTRGLRETIPIVLDEPLASSDDERFLQGMKFFMDELSRDYQLFILTCHTERHQWLREQVGSLFDERVHTIYLRPAARPVANQAGN